MTLIMDLSRLWHRRPTLNEATIAIWGATQAGKTAFLAALESAARHEGMALFSVDAQTENMMKVLRTQRSEHQFPVATPIPAAFQELSLLRFGLSSTRMNQTIRLTIVDASGMWWIAAGMAPEDCAFSPYTSILKQCNGLICLLDPTKALTSTGTPLLAGQQSMGTPVTVELQSMVAQLRRVTMTSANRLNTKIAICLAQMDRPEHYSHLGKEAAYFKRLYGAVPIDNWVAANRWKFFGCSAVGVLPRAGYLVSNTYKDQTGQTLILEPTAPPLHLFRPIRWLLGLP
jgi:hypothetical protein